MMDHYMQIWTQPDCACLKEDSHPVVTLTLWDRDKTAAISRRYFQMHFPEWKCINFDKDFTEVFIIRAFNMIWFRSQLPSRLNPEYQGIPLYNLVTLWLSNRNPETGANSSSLRCPAYLIKYPLHVYIFKPFSTQYNIYIHIWASHGNYACFHLPKYTADRIRLNRQQHKYQVLINLCCNGACVVVSGHGPDYGPVLLCRIYRYLPQYIWLRSNMEISMPFPAIKLT